MIGYEIKCTTADWRRDDKIHDYMPLCHLLYIVAPKGVVPPDELPAGVGLLEPVGGAGRLQTRRKATRREVALPAELLVYVLMCRTKITREQVQPEDRNWRREELREWVEGKRERQHLATAVSAKIREAYMLLDERIRNEKYRHDELENVRRRITELGFDVSRPVSEWEVKRRIEAMNRTVDGHTLNQLRTVASTISKLADALERLRRGADEDGQTPENPEIPAENGA